MSWLLPLMDECVYPYSILYTHAPNHIIPPWWLSELQSQRLNTWTNPYSTYSGYLPKPNVQILYSAGITTSTLWSFLILKIFCDGSEKKNENSDPPQLQKGFVYHFWEGGFCGCIIPNYNRVREHGTSRILRKFIRSVAKMLVTPYRIHFGKVKDTFWEGRIHVGKVLFIPG